MTSSPPLTLLCVYTEEQILLSGYDSLHITDQPGVSLFPIRGYLQTSWGPGYEAFPGQGNPTRRTFHFKAHKSYSAPLPFFLQILRVCVGSRGARVKK